MLHFERTPITSLEEEATASEDSSSDHDDGSLTSEVLTVQKIAEEEISESSPSQLINSTNNNNLSTTNTQSQTLPSFNQIINSLDDAPPSPLNTFSSFTSQPSVRFIPSETPMPTTRLLNILPQSTYNTGFSGQFFSPVQEPSSLDIGALQRLIYQNGHTDQEKYIERQLPLISVKELAQIHLEFNTFILHRIIPDIVPPVIAFKQAQIENGNRLDIMTINEQLPFMTTTLLINLYTILISNLKPENKSKAALELCQLEDAKIPMRPLKRGELEMLEPFPESQPERDKMLSQIREKISMINSICTKIENEYDLKYNPDHYYLWPSGTESLETLARIDKKLNSTLSLFRKYESHATLLTETLNQNQLIALFLRNNALAKPEQTQTTAPSIRPYTFKF